MSIGWDVRSDEFDWERLLDSARFRWTLLLLGILLWIPPVWRRVSATEPVPKTAAAVTMSSPTEEVH